MPAAVAESNLAVLLEFPGGAKPQFRFEERQVSRHRLQFGLDAGRQHHCADHTTGCAAVSAQRFRLVRHPRGLADEMHRVEDLPHIVRFKSAGHNR
jgi:hypothetical protein